MKLNLNRKPKHSEYTCKQILIVTVVSVAVVLIYWISGCHFGWTWPPDWVSIAKAVGALSAAASAFISVAKEDRQEKLDALKDEMKASSDDCADQPGAHAGLSDDCTGLSDDCADQPGAHADLSHDPEKCSDSVKSCRIGQLCFLIVAFAAAAIAI